MSDEKQARRYFVSGTVQGVGYRYFTLHAAEKLHLKGYVRNLRDGRVEIFAVGTSEQLAELRNALARGPLLSNVTEVKDETAMRDPLHEHGFVIQHDEWR